MLTSLGALDEATVVDLFAGSGSFGIECLSRGADHVTFVERDRAAVAVIEANLDLLDFADRATIVRAPVEAAVDGLPPADLAFCDPPYPWDDWPQLLPSIRAEVLVTHADRPIDLPETWTPLRERTYGRSRIVIAQRCPE